MYVLNRPGCKNVVGHEGGVASRLPHRAGTHAGSVPHHALSYRYLSHLDRLSNLHFRLLCSSENIAPISFGLKAIKPLTPFRSNPISSERSPGRSAVDGRPNDRDISAEDKHPSSLPPAITILPPLVLLPLKYDKIDPHQEFVDEGCLLSRLDITVERLTSGPLSPNICRKYEILADRYFQLLGKYGDRPIPVSEFRELEKSIEAFEELRPNLTPELLAIQNALLHSQRSEMFARWGPVMAEKVPELFSKVDKMTRGASDLCNGEASEANEKTMRARTEAAYEEVQRRLVEDIVALQADRATLDEGQTTSELGCTLARLRNSIEVDKTLDDKEKQLRRGQRDKELREDRRQLEREMEEMVRQFEELDKQADMKLDEMEKQLP